MKVFVLSLLLLVLFVVAHKLLHKIFLLVILLFAPLVRKNVLKEKLRFVYVLQANAQEYQPKKDVAS
jgi:hypothetical protein